MRNLILKHWYRALGIVTVIYLVAVMIAIGVTLYAS